MENDRTDDRRRSMISEDDKKKRSKKDKRKRVRGNKSMDFDQEEFMFQMNDEDRDTKKKYKKNGKRKDTPSSDETDEEIEPSTSPSIYPKASLSSKRRKKQRQSRSGSDIYPTMKRKKHISLGSDETDTITERYLEESGDTGLPIDVDSSSTSDDSMSPGFISKPIIDNGLGWLKDFSGDDIESHYAKYRSKTPSLEFRTPENIFRNDEKVKLNVGGRVFETYISTLRKLPDTLLGAMFHERNSNMLDQSKGDDGNYFFDRDPRVFESILNFYRTGRLIVPDWMPLELLREELDYFSLQIPEDIDHKRISMELRKLEYKDKIYNASEYRKLTRHKLLSDHHATLVVVCVGLVLNAYFVSANDKGYEYIC
eukprot:TRINITY_DN5467_c0_g1_i2.p1 TRINITY_DN5467_c0_g1~~TRINITY_DN5467_c0_g1_i2.p1  ORF type:complete len:369 (-),score=91.27 TRINITY_DN5467_c0_g1_i2:401-1507(-)